MKRRLKTMHKASTFTLCVLAAVSPLSAALADSAYKRCTTSADDKTDFMSAYGQCGADWIQREDDKLNAVWKKVYGPLEGQTKKDLLAEQRAWIPYKESTCQFYLNGDWGRQAFQIDFARCRAKVIASRTRELQAYGKYFGN